MPIYEYRCEACGEINEVFQKFSDPPPKKCQFCEKEVLTKMISHSSFVLKGGGWFSEEYCHSCKDKESCVEKGPETPSSTKKPDKKGKSLLIPNQNVLKKVKIRNSSY